MTPDEISAAIVRLQQAIDDRLSGADAVRVRDGDRETEFARASVAEMQQRLSALKALQSGCGPRIAARRVYF